MRKVLCAAFVACMFAFLSVLSVPAAQAKPVMNAEGVLLYQTITPTTMKSAGGNTILQGTSEITASGAFAGDATDVWKEMDHAGHINFNDILTIDLCTVGDKSGKLTLKLVGYCPMSDLQYTGHWTILYGTDGLSNLYGQGTWSADASTGQLPLPVLYEGCIQFD